jgi:hypothetical protein
MGLVKSGTDLSGRFWLRAPIPVMDQINPRTGFQIQNHKKAAVSKEVRKNKPHFLKIGQV